MATGAHKHKKLGYRLFKDKYVSQVQVKPNVKTAHGVKFLVKAAVHASMKKQSCVVYVHLNQLNGEVVHANCACVAGKCGCCKRVAALLYLINDFIQLELSEVPDAHNYFNSGMFRDLMKQMSLFFWKTLNLRSLHLSKIIKRKQNMYVVVPVDIKRHTPHTTLCQGTKSRKSPKISTRTRTGRQSKLFK